MLKPTKQHKVSRIHEPWPEKELERVPQCPVCGSKARMVMYQSLRDWVFYCAPGEWTLYYCKGCGSAYLDPRPAAEAIGLAYEVYYTHDSAPVVDSVSRRARIRRMLGNGYRNWRYGTSLKPASFLGVVVAALRPASRANIDADMRHLGKARPGHRLLDIGCGGGEFMKKAESAGWEVTGIDVDPAAVARARSRGLHVREGGVEVLRGTTEAFDAITMGHVIEHVPDPMELLARCYELLRPGGSLWLETPNLNALGHQRYGRSWRGLEAPRHLLLFSTETLVRALVGVGFESPVLQGYRPIAHKTFCASEAILNGRDPYSRIEVPEGLRQAIREADRQQKKRPNVREFVTVKAEKTL